MENNGMWYEDFVTFKDTKVVFKKRDSGGNFEKSIIVPSVIYPLNDKYEAFTYKNTKPVTDEEILKIFDSVQYQIGRCYTNTEKLVAVLRAAGCDVKAYAGWLFMAGNEYPIHHAWCVLNENSILDLADDLFLMLGGENGKYFEQAKSKDEKRALMVSFQAWARQLPNSKRCLPVGVPCPTTLYVGCPCEPEQARCIYNNLIRQYPAHECQRNCDENGWNKTQKMFREAGLM